MQFTSYLVSILLIFVFYQDLKYRAVSWLLFPVGLILFFIEGNQYENIYAQLNSFLINLGICLVIFILLTVYFSMRNKKFTNIIDTYIGKGDLLFIPIISVSFSTVNFILFINLSLLTIIIIYLLFTGVFKFDKNKIPFAGLLALFYLIYLVCNNLWLELNPYNDINIYSFL